MHANSCAKGLFAPSENIKDQRTSERDQSEFRFRLPSVWMDLNKWREQECDTLHVAWTKYGGGFFPQNHKSLVKRWIIHVMIDLTRRKSKAVSSRWREFDWWLVRVTLAVRLLLTFCPKILEGGEVLRMVIKSCSFWQKKCSKIIGFSPNSGVGAPSGKSWIRHCERDPVRGREPECARTLSCLRLPNN